MDRYVIDFKQNTEQTIEALLEILRNMFDRDNIEFTKTNSFEYSPMYNMIRDELKISVHRVSNKGKCCE